MTKLELIAKLKSTMWASGAHSDTDTMNLMEEIIADVETMDEPPVLMKEVHELFEAAADVTYQGSRRDRDTFVMAYRRLIRLKNSVKSYEQAIEYGPIPEGPQPREEMS